MMQIITLFILIFFASVFFKIFQYFNIWMDDQAGESFFKEIKRDIFGR